MRKKSLLSLLLIVATTLSFFSCEEKENKPAGTFKVEPEEILFETIGEEVMLKATLNGEEVKASYQATPEGLVEISPDGKVKLIKEGAGTITAKYEEYSATIKFATAELYVLPYLRMFDGVERIKAYEESLGHKLVNYDADFNTYYFYTNSKLFPQVIYIIGQMHVMYSTPEVLKSKEFQDFMKENGFNTTGEISYGYYMPFTSNFETIEPWACVENMPDYGLNASMCFQVKNPIIQSLSYPKLDWGTSAATIDAFETARGYAKNTERNLAEGRKTVIYTYKKELPEFTEMYINYYFFDSSDKLIKVASLLFPAQYVLTPMGEAYNFNADFEEFIATEGYTKNLNEEEHFAVFTNEAKDNKFTINMWNITLDGSVHVGAAFEYVPFNGPDEIDIDLN